MLAVGWKCEIRVCIRVMRHGRLGTTNWAERLAILTLDACHVQSVCSVHGGQGHGLVYTTLLPVAEMCVHPLHNAGGTDCTRRPTSYALYWVDRGGCAWFVVGRNKAPAPDLTPIGVCRMAWSNRPQEFGASNLDITRISKLVAHSFISILYGNNRYLPLCARPGNQVPCQLCQPRVNIQPTNTRADPATVGSRSVKLIQWHHSLYLCLFG
jgi:hypothetical protein